MLKEIIKGKGYKQKFLAEKIGVTEVTLSNWVNGKTVPKDKHILKLSQVLDIPFETLKPQL